MMNLADVYFDTNKPHVIYVVPRPRQTFLETLLANEKLLELVHQFLQKKMNGRVEHAQKPAVNGAAKERVEREREEVSATD